MNRGRYPDFFILGAPKCGTTTLARWLSGHPGVFMSVPKEPHYFNDDMANRNIRTDRQYRALFRKVMPHHLVSGEASTWYLFSRRAVPRIEQMCREPRYIVMTRDPVQMANSLYVHNLRHLYEDAPSFERAWELQEERLSGKAIPRSCREPMFLQYKQVCSLGEQIQRLFEYSPADRVLHIDLGGLQREPAVQYRRVLKFLGVAADGREQFGRENEARVARSLILQRVLLAGGRLRRAMGIRQGVGLLRLNERKTKKAEVPQALRETLHEEFRRDSDLLQHLCGGLKQW